MISPVANQASLLVAFIGDISLLTSETSDTRGQEDKHDTCVSSGSQDREAELAGFGLACPVGSFDLKRVIAWPKFVRA